MGRSWKDLIVWQKSHEFVLYIYGLLEEFPKEEKYGLVAQIERASISIPTNIVEGRSKSSNKEFLKFLYISRDSLEEVKYLLILSRDLNYISKEIYLKLEEKLSKIGMLLNNLIKSIDSRTTSTTSTTPTTPTTPKTKGFTLIELIIAIVLLGIVAGVGVNLIMPIFTGYVDTRTKEYLFNEVKYGVQRMDRELRMAVPNSVKVIDSGNGIRFMKLYSGNYYEKPKGKNKNYLNIFDNCSNILKAFDPATKTTNDNLTVYVTKPDKIYNTPKYWYNASKCYNKDNITISNDLKAQSPYNRFYVIDTPMTFYQRGTRIYMSRDYNWTTTDGTDNSSPHYRLMSYVNDIDFNYEPGIPQKRNGVVTIAITMRKGTTTLNYKHQVHIRNVP
ncbi:four helix bundle protein [Flexistipes sp.]|uniref:four helix bundle protein n=1 Tax=Flexistipes sp. TaxID=3088135 RepID=UPI002E1FB3A3|nr:four helix bundle protein [Flexistipes sp.]